MVSYNRHPRPSGKPCRYPTHWKTPPTGYRQRNRLLLQTKRRVVWENYHCGKKSLSRLFIGEVHCMNILISCQYDEEKLHIAHLTKGVIGGSELAACDFDPKTPAGSSSRVPRKISAIKLVAIIIPRRECWRKIGRRSSVLCEEPFRIDEHQVKVVDCRGLHHPVHTTRHKLAGKRSGTDADYCTSLRPTRN